MSPERQRQEVEDLLAIYEERIRHWMGPYLSHREPGVSAWRHIDFHRGRNGKHLKVWHEGTHVVRNAVRHVRSLRLALKALG